MNLRSILEEYDTTFKSGNKTVEIFRNPSKKEFKEAAKTYKGNLYIRFIATKGKDLFVFRPDVFHDSAAKEIFLTNKNISYSEIEKLIKEQLWGTATSEDKGNTWIFDGSDNPIPSLDWSWLKEKGIGGKIVRNPSIMPSQIKQ